MFGCFAKAGGREMSDRPTPETDAQGYGDGRHPYVATDFARKLERERDEARERERVAIVSWEEEHQRALREGQRVVEAREKVKELIYIAQRAIALAEIDFENDKFGSVSELRAELDQLKEDAK
jgi:hypothetical protein